MPKIICIDFDGVLHSYGSGWKGATEIPDPPTPGAIEWLIALCDDPDVEPAIYSSRSRYDNAVDAMKTWLVSHGFPQERLDEGRITFPTQKPAAFLTIDDRAIRFTGKFPPIDDLKGFKPWNKGGETAIAEAVRVLSKALRDDPGFYIAYQSNIAVAIQDEFKELVPIDELNELANKAAKRFMNWWGCGDGSEE